MPSPPLLRPRAKARRSFIAVVGHAPDLEREEGAVNILRSLGAQVRTLDLWEEPAHLFQKDEGEDVRALIVEAMDRPDLAVRILRALRKDSRLCEVPAIAALTVAQVARLEPAGGFDDFVLVPYVPAELYARIRRAEWNSSEFSTEQRDKIGPVVIDREGREVTAFGLPVPLTAKEFALLAYLCERRGRLVTRDEILSRVWGDMYEGTSRTIDIHVRRLRKKLGSAVRIVTLHGSGYKLAASASGDSEADDDEDEGEAAQEHHRNDKKIDRIHQHRMSERHWS